MARALSRTVPVRMLAANGGSAAEARKMAGEARIDILEIAFGDIWLRDTAPLFMSPALGHTFRFNGWGGKYALPGDDGVGAAIGADAAAEIVPHDLVLEGGSIDGDGSGLFVTTEQCLLNPNRNGAVDRKYIENVLREALGVRRLIWLGEGLQNDHTDGHIDNLARFAAPGTLLIPVAAGPDDPNAAIYADAHRRAQDNGVVVLDMPSVGRFEQDGELVPASYMNFVIANGQVVVPLYGVPNDENAVKALKKAFPGHKVTGLPANHILTGGGSFHCITQQVPEAK